MSSGFYGGVHPPTTKGLTLDRPIKKDFIPSRVIIPLLQHVGQPAEPVAAVGDIVEAGSIIGKETGFISSPVHASISGKVTRISYHPTPTLSRVVSITIESEVGSLNEFKPVKRSGVESLSKEELIDIIRNAGIVGLGGAAFPTHVKLSPPKEKPVDTVILNGAECEPYLTCDHHLMIEKPKEILMGLEIIERILNAKNTYVAIEDNKRSAIYAMEKALERSKVEGRRHALSEVEGSKVEIVVLKTKYPQGAEKQVIKAVVNRVVPAGGLPMDVGCVVQNVGTAFAIYEAVYLGKPLVERLMTVAGDCLKEPVDMAVKIGTLLSDLPQAVGGFMKEPKKVIVGGPMMGIAQWTMDIPITKGTSGVIFLSEERIDSSSESVCIRCGKCIEVCPMELAPTTLMSHVKKEKFKVAKELGITNCYECGACAYACPAKIPLLDFMKYGKAKAN